MDHPTRKTKNLRLEFGRKNQGNNMANVRLDASLDVVIETKSFYHKGHKMAKFGLIIFQCVSNQGRKYDVCPMVAEHTFPRLRRTNNRSTSPQVSWFSVKSTPVPTNTLGITCDRRSQGYHHLYSVVGYLDPPDFRKLGCNVVSDKPSSILP
jgi:hypothetical protein